VAKNTRDGQLIEISSISNADAKKYFEEHSAFRGDFTLALCVKEGDITHGVLAFTCDGGAFAKSHISTDGNAHIGSLLYGAMVRVAMALGYKQITV
jgi:hypothetical protein